MIRKIKKNLLASTTIALFLAVMPLPAFAGPYEDGVAALHAGNYAKAEAFFHKASQADNSQAFLALGKLYYDGHGQYKEERYNFASANYFKAAKLGNGEAQYLLAKMYEKGIGIEQSFAMAAEYYQQASDSGFESSGNSPALLAAQSNAAAMFEAGADEDLEIGNFEQAFSAYKMLSDTEDHAKSQYIIAKMYIAGKGVTHSAEQALLYIKMAANNGYPEAQFHLGMLYINGTGVTQSKTDAIVWFKKAAAQDHKNAKTALKQLGAE